MLAKQLIQIKDKKLNSEVYVAFNIKERMAVVGGTYGGEIKKGFFSMMNYFLPLRGIAAMHCSANMGKMVIQLFSLVYGTGKLLYLLTQVALNWR